MIWIIPTNGLPRSANGKDEESIIAISSFIVKHCIQCYRRNNILNLADCSCVNKSNTASGAIKVYYRRLCFLYYAYPFRIA